MRPAYLILIGAFAAPVAVAAEGQAPATPAVEPLAALSRLGLPSQDAVLTSSPGRARPIQPAPAAALRFLWEDSRSLVVIEPGAGRLRTAWVLTLKAEALHQIAVAYRGRAYRDQNGAIHVDAHIVDRKQGMVGVQTGNWFPDSFAFPGGDRVVAIDDQKNARLNGGTVDLALTPQDGEAFARLAHLARCVNEECF